MPQKLKREVGYFAEVEIDKHSCVTAPGIADESDDTGMHIVDAEAAAEEPRRKGGRGKKRAKKSRSGGCGASCQDKEVMWDVLPSMEVSEGCVGQVFRRDGPRGHALQEKVVWTHRRRQVYLCAAHRSGVVGDGAEARRQRPPHAVDPGRGGDGIGCHKHEPVEDPLYPEESGRNIWGGLAAAVEKWSHEMFTAEGIIAVL